MASHTFECEHGKIVLIERGRRPSGCLLCYPESEPHQISEGLDALEEYRLRQRLEAENAIFIDTVKYMAENTHQAYHQDSNDGWWACPKNVCTSAQRVLPKHVLWLSGKGPKP